MGWSKTKEAAAVVSKKAVETSTVVGAKASQTFQPVGETVKAKSTQVGAYMAPGATKAKEGVVDVAEKAKVGIVDLSNNLNKKIDENETLSAAKQKSVEGVKVAGAFLGRSWNALWKSNAVEEPQEEEELEKVEEVAVEGE